MISLATAFSCQQGFSMRVLVVQNYDNTGLGQVGAALA
ncbi:GMP synthase, partial [Mesorhizobium sp. M2D.F.Ca.ET.145.01.1.1]